MVFFTEISNSHFKLEMPLLAPDKLDIELNLSHKLIINNDLNIARLIKFSIKTNL